MPKPTLEPPPCLENVPAQVRRLLQLGTRPADVEQSFRDVFAGYLAACIASSAREIAADCRARFNQNRRRSPAPPWEWTRDDPEPDVAILRQKILDAIVAHNEQLADLRQVRDQLQAVMRTKRKPTKSTTEPRRPRRRKK